MCEFCEDRSNFLDPTKSYRWHNRYMAMAMSVGSWSKDPSTKIGAVAVGKHGQILSTGYNGFPRKIEDKISDYENREIKYKKIIHAEMNLIFNASLSGISLEGSTLYIDGLPPCENCALGVIQVGISEVVIRAEDINKNTRWMESWIAARALLNEAKVKITVV